MNLLSKIKIKVIIGIFLVFSVFGASQVQAAGVTLSASPTSNTINVGQTAIYTININRDGFADKVTLTANGLPAGASAAFTPNTTTANSSTLKITTLTSTPVGTFNITVKGTATGITIAPIIVKLITNPSPSVELSANPTSQAIVIGQTTYYDISIARTNFDGQLTLSAENVPQGATVVFEPSVTYGNSSRMYIYSNRMPLQSNSFGMYVRATGLGIDKNLYLQLQTQVINWSAQFGTPNNQTVKPDYATDVTYDSAGNVYVTGYNFLPSAPFDHDAWVAKYNSSGTQLWVRDITTLTQDKPTDVFVDSAGQVYIAGTTFSGTSYDIFAVKYDANGNRVGNIQILGSSVEDGSGGMQFGVNSSNSITLTAVIQINRFRTGVDSNDPGTEPDPDFFGNVAYHVDYDVTRFVFNNSFTSATATALVTNAVGNPKDLTVGGDGSVYVLTEDLSGLNPMIDHRLLVNSRVEKFLGPNNQNYLSAVIGPTSTNSLTSFYASRLKVDGQGNVFAIGNEFDRSQLIDDSAILNNSWMVKLNSTGVISWENKLLSYHPTEIKALDVDGNGNVYFAGYTYDSLALTGFNPNGGIPGSMGVTTDAWLAKYSGIDGAKINVNQFNVDNKDGFNAIKVRGSGMLISRSVYLAGYGVFFNGLNYGYEDALVVRGTIR